MRRNYISPEFTYTETNGTYNMIELRSFFGSKMVDVEDVIGIKNSNVIYYQNANGEQMDAVVESALDPIVYSEPISKKDRHVIQLNPTQSPSDKDKFTKWIIDIDLKSLLFEYIFAKLKEARTFEGIPNNQTINNNVNISINDYIEYNLWSRYVFKSVELFVKYTDLKSQNIRRFQIQYDAGAEDPGLVLQKMESEITYDKKKLTLRFQQEKPSSEFTFSYYYNVYFERA
jgi:hypothetical protein